MDGYSENREPAVPIMTTTSHSLAENTSDSMEVSFGDQTKTVNVSKISNIEAQNNNLSKNLYIYQNVIQPRSTNNTRVAPNRISTLPPPNPDFVYIGDGHKALIEDLKKKLIQHRRLAIHGLIGTGKWEMALQVAHAIRHEMNITSSFWICANSASTFERDYEGIAHLVKIPGVVARTGQSLLKGVQLWLEDSRNGDWLIVLDDINENTITGDRSELQTDVKFSRHNAPTTFLPQGNGYLLITTGDSDLAFQLVRRRDLLCKIPRLSTSEACELLRSKTPDVLWLVPSSTEDARRLVTKLDNHPSAIILAAAYIDNHYKIGETIAGYLEGLMSVGHSEMLSRGPHDSLVCHGFPSSPISAWQKSFTKIQNESPQAIDILALMSCFDHTQIPKSLLECYKLSANDLRYHLRTLERYSFIDTYDNGNTFHIPKILQITAQEWLKGHGTRAMWQSKALQALLKQYNKIQTKSQGTSIPPYVQQRQLLSQIDVFEEYCRKEGPPIDLIPEITPAIISFAGLYAGEGRYGPAQRFLCYVRDYYLVEDIWRIRALKDLAETIRSNPSAIQEKRNKELKMARDSLQEARRIAQKMDDRDAEIDVLNSLALSYTETGHLKPAKDHQKEIQRRFTLAEKFQKEVVAHKSRQFGDNNLETINAILGLSRIYFRRGRNRLDSSNSPTKEAQQDLSNAETAQTDLFARMSSQIAEFPKDAERISVLYDVRAALARSYFSQRKFELAEEQAREAHAGRMQLFGQYDLKTLGVEEDWCVCLVELGRIEEAVRRLQGVLERLTEKFGSRGYRVGRCEGKLADFRARNVAGV